MTDPLAPPLPEPLDPAVRARLRARVLADVEDAAGPSWGRWAVPLATAAAVAVVGTTAAVVGLTADGERSAPDPLGGPPTTTAAAPSPPAGPSPTRTPSPTLPVLPEEGGTLTYDPSTGELPGYVDTEPDDCPSEVRFVLKGAEPVVEVVGEASTGTFLVRGDRWVQCTEGPEAVTVTGDRVLGAPFADDDATPWQVSTDTSDYTRSSMTQLFVAGGPLPEGITGIAYRFPGGAEERAEVVRDDDGRAWWRMEHVATQGVLADPRQSLQDLDPIEVTVSLSGRQVVVPLRWGVDTCAQLNHGC